VQRVVIGVTGFRIDAEMMPTDAHYGAAIQQGQSLCRGELGI
jgi:hypothetical protein